MAPRGMLLAAEGDTTWAEMLFLLLLLVGLVTKMWLGYRGKKRKDKQLGGSFRFRARVVGLNYLGGHPRLAMTVTGATVATSNEWLVVEDFSSVVLKMPIGEVRGIQVETDEEARQRFTVTRMALIGVFALALPKKTSGSVLITIETVSGPLLFEHTGKNKSEVLSETAALRSNIALHGAATQGRVDPLPKAPAGRWVPDPTTRHEFRYWTGSEWTEHVTDEGVPGIDPPVMDSGSP